MQEFFGRGGPTGRMFPPGADFGFSSPTQARLQDTHLPESNQAPGLYTRSILSPGIMRRIQKADLKWIMSVSKI